MRYELEHPPESANAVVVDTRTQDYDPASEAEVEWWERIGELEAELAAARKDTERLDWFATQNLMDGFCGQDIHEHAGMHCTDNSDSDEVSYRLGFRSAIDAAMSGCQLCAANTPLMPEEWLRGRWHVLPKPQIAEPCATTVPTLGDSTDE